MINWFKIIKGHLTVAKEHCEEWGINHTPTLLEAVKTTLHNALHYSYIQKDDGYLVYEKITKHTLGLTVYKIVSIYVPVDQRGKGLAKQLIDLAPTPLLVSGYEDNEYECVGTVRLIRK